MQNIHEQEQTAGDTDCQTGDVDETVGFILHNAAQGYFQEVFKHRDKDNFLMMKVSVKKFYTEKKGPTHP
jgi:hypothetical protein